MRKFVNSLEATLEEILPILTGEGCYSTDHSDAMKEATEAIVLELRLTFTEIFVE